MGAAFFFAIACLLALAGCEQKVGRQVPQMIRKLPHDPGAFTQGLLVSEGRFYESTGLKGRSSLREVDRESGEVLRIVSLPAEYFGEGLAMVDDRLIQLTWQSGVAFVYDRQTLVRQGTFAYAGEGWGLCYDGESLYMSDGSATLFRRDPKTFAVLSTSQVMLNGVPVRKLNELECVGTHVYANIFLTNRIVKINKKSGRVVAEIDASALTAMSGRPANPEAVLNGIAYEPESDTFYLTGKFWPAIFQVRFGKQ
jgi:glutaminyl-peptide cyclotransferase